MKIRKSNIYTCLVILFPICNLIGGLFSYYDEFIGILGFFYLWLLILKGGLQKDLKIIVILLTIITVIGVVSNIISGITYNIFAIFVDCLWLWKTFACFILASQLYSNKYVLNRTVKSLIKPAAFTIVFIVFLCLLSQIINIGVSSQSPISGIQSFKFFWNSFVQTGWLIISCLIILALSTTDEKKVRKYLLMSLIPLFLTFSSMVYCWIVVTITLFFILRRNKTFKFVYLIPIIVVIALFTWSDLQTYYIDQTSSIRSTFLQKAVEIANTYFPFGSGFATFGSEMASRYYSRLYITFGWENTWAFGTQSSYLNDNFFASIIGQFGWIGFLLYLLILYKLFCLINSNKINKTVRIFSISTVITLCAAMIGSATVKSMMGVCLFYILGIVYGKILSTQKTRKNTCTIVISQNKNIVL